jgi:hypothetical protein
VKKEYVSVLDKVVEEFHKCTNMENSEVIENVYRNLTNLEYLYYGGDKDKEFMVASPYFTATFNCDDEYFLDELHDKFRETFRYNNNVVKYMASVCRKNYDFEL